MGRVVFFPASWGQFIFTKITVEILKKINHNCLTLSTIKSVRPSPPTVTILLSLLSNKIPQGSLFSFLNKTWEIFGMIKMHEKSDRLLSIYFFFLTYDFVRFFFSPEEGKKIRQYLKGHHCYKEQRIISRWKRIETHEYTEEKEKESVHRSK